MKRLRMFKLLSLLLLIAVIMEFVPIKIAKRIQNVTYNDEKYVCKYVTATDGNWLAEKKYNTNLNDSIYINIEGTTAFNSLSEISNISLGTPILNMYIFQGKIEKKEVSKDVSFNWIKLRKWDIVYPIQRQSLREIYAPKSYLTIYDFNWFELILNSFFKGENDEIY